MLPDPDHISEKQADNIWDNLEIGIAYVGLNGEWLRVNPTLCALLEYSESEMRSRTFQDVTHPDDVRDDVAMVEKLKTGHLDFYTMTKRYITKTNQVLWIKLKVTTETDEEGNVLFFLSQILPKDHGEIKTALVASHHPAQATLIGVLRKDWLKAMVIIITMLGSALTFVWTTASKWSRIEAAVERLEQRDP